MTGIWLWALSVWNASVLLLQFAASGQPLAIALLSGIAALICGIARVLWRREWRAWPFLVIWATSGVLLILSMIFYGQLKEPLLLVGAVLLLQAAACGYIVRGGETSTVTALLLSWATLVLSSTAALGATLYFDGAVF